MGVIEVQVHNNDEWHTTEVTIGERLAEPYYRMHAAHLTRLRHESDFSISLPSLRDRASLDDLRQHMAFMQQVLATAEQFAAQIAAEKVLTAQE